MDFISDNLIFIVFIVLAVVSQIGRLLVRNAERRKREERAEDRQGAPAYNAYEYGDDAEDKDDDAFSAWALSVDVDDEEEDEAVPAAAPRPVAVPLSAPPLAPVPGASLFPALIAAPVAEKYGQEAAFSSSTREPEPSINARRKGRNAVPAAFPEKLDYLPPLKRAVVLAEILGPPKGL